MARFRLPSLALTVIVAASSSYASLVSTGLSVTFNDVYYFISPYSSGKVDVTSVSALSKVPTVLGFKPVTVVQGAVAQGDLAGLFSTWEKTDDVYQTAFSQAVYLASANESCITKKAIIKDVSSLVIPLNVTTIPSGPYFLEVASGKVYPVYRLYEDFSGSFTESLLQTPEGKFQPLSAQITGSASLTVGVPSRLYYTKTAAKPLAGVRIGVKDIFELAGTKMSCGNRAYWSLYPANNETGTAMQRLIDAGAQIVGLQKPSQFANGEQATADWVDYHSPFSARGDGYQDPSSSSAGAGASMSSYDWLDIAVGSDTGGSIRGPSGVGGLWGSRPSHGLVSLDHAMPLSTALDTVGFLLRDPYLWDVANKALYQENYNSLASAKPNYPKKVYTISFPTNTNTPANAMLVNFLNSLTKFIGGTSSPIVLANEWNATRPAEAGGASLNVFMNTTYPTFISKEQIALVRNPFYRDYAAVHDGRRPFVDPAPLARWAYGDSVPDSALDDAIRNKTIFMDWFNTKILPPVEDKSQCSSAFMIYVANSGAGNNPRNQYINPPSVPFGFSSGRISVMAEVPDFVFPIGQVASQSSITKHAEFFPVGIDIMAAKGCDGLLVKLAQDLTNAGILAVPKAGGTLTGGDILMKKRAEEMGIKDVRYVR